MMISTKELNMNTNNIIKKLILRKFVLWGIITAVLFAVCYFYHSKAETKFSPLISIALLILLSFITFNSLGIANYIRDKEFSGRITELKVISKRYMNNAIDRDVQKRTFVMMSIECDDGKTIKFEQMLPEHETRIIPYRVGDRVLHIKGAPNLCRFPRNDTETKYDPISVICPICGACLPLGTKDCPFCEIALPWDPAVK